MLSTMITDLYQLTMGQCYFNEGRQNEVAYFDAFFRRIPDDGGYAISSGLRNIIDFIKNFKFTEEDISYLKALNKFTPEYLSYLKNLRITCDIYGVADGSVVFANEPLITVRGPIIQAQLLETIILIYLNHSTLIATKASRINYAARGREVLEFGARRAHGTTAAVEGALDCFIGGCSATSCVETGKKYGVPVAGTMAHSFIQSYGSEQEAFKAYAKNFPDSSVFLVDTYDTLKSGVPNAIAVAREVLKPMGKALKGIRLDSGDLAYLAKEARKMLDNAGMAETKIIVSNSLDEYIIDSLLGQGAPIDVFGVGENMITSRSSPVLEGIYKLMAVEKSGKIIPKIKVSDNIEKITIPHFKQVYRFIDKKTGCMIADLIALRSEKINESGYKMVNHSLPWNKKFLSDYKLEKLGTQIFKGGKLVYKQPSVQETKLYCTAEKAKLADEVKRLKNPHKYIVEISPKLQRLKEKLLAEESKKL